MLFVLLVLPLPLLLLNVHAHKSCTAAAEHLFRTSIDIR